MSWIISFQNGHLQIREVCAQSSIVPQRLNPTFSYDFTAVCARFCPVIKLSQETEAMIQAKAAQTGGRLTRFCARRLPAQATCCRGGVPLRRALQI